MQVNRRTKAGEEGVGELCFYCGELQEVERRFKVQGSRFMESGFGVVLCVNIRGCIMVKLELEYIQWSLND